MLNLQLLMEQSGEGLRLWHAEGGLERLHINRPAVSFRPAAALPPSYVSWVACAPRSAATAGGCAVEGGVYPPGQRISSAG